MLLFLASLFLAIGAFEYIFPAEEHQKFSDRLQNVAFGAIYLSCSLLLVKLVNVYFYPVPRLTVPSKWYFLVLAIIVVLILKDLIFYVYHRTQHAFKPLWELHKLHHEDQALNVSTTIRTHVLDAVLQHIIIALPVAYLLGLDASSTGILFLITTVWLFFDHANIRCHLGRFGWILIGPQAHRIHHSVEPKHQQKNFALYFSFIDVIFGTYYHANENEYPTTGLNSGE